MRSRTNRTERVDKVIRAPTENAILIRLGYVKGITGWAWKLLKLSVAQLSGHSKRWTVGTSLMWIIAHQGAHLHRLRYVATICLYFSLLTPKFAAVQDPCPIQSLLYLIYSALSFVRPLQQTPDALRLKNLSQPVHMSHGDCAFELSVQWYGILSSWLVLNQGQSAIW
jgi:hypothetical protein